jgi:prepilin-type N-terminal cleavage/methylation domain-containing protein
VPHRFRSQGFTLLELITVLAVVAILASLAAVAVLRGTSRIRVSNAAFEVGALYTAAQMRATSLGVPHYVVFHDDGTEFGVYLLERPDGLSPVDWTHGQVKAPELLGGAVHEHLRLSREHGLGFVDFNASVVQPLPAPFTSISLSASGTGGLLAGCTFCSMGDGGARGVIRFSPDGTVKVLSSTSSTLTPGGVLGFAPEGQAQPRLVVIAAPAGAIRVF